MIRKNLGLIIILFVLLMAILLGTNQPDPLNWRPNFNAESKDPLGASIIQEELNEVFPKSQVFRNRSPLSSNALNYYESTTLMFMHPEFQPGEVDIDWLKEYANRGNKVFIASYNFSEYLMDALNVEQNLTYNADSLGVYRSAIDPDEDIQLLNVNFNYQLTSFYLYPDFGGKVLAWNQQNELPIMLSIPYGEGEFVLLSKPDILANIQLIRNESFAEKILSYIRNPVVVWDDYYKPYRQSYQDPLAFFRSSKPLLLSFRLLVLSMLLMMIFWAKRKQRFIPILGKPVNESLQFIKTVGNLYFNQGNHKKLATKKWQHFVRSVWEDYRVKPEQEDFVERLSERSGVDRSIIQELMESQKKIHEKKSIGPNLLLELTKRIDAYYGKRT